MSSRRIVIKVGTSSIIETAEDGTTKLALVNLATVVDVLTSLKRAGHDVVLVSSGAVGAGCHQLGIAERPTNLNAKRALASIGQVHLMSKYEQLFGALGFNCAQLLLTYENFVDRKQFINAKNTFVELFNLGVIPVVNENDCVGVRELKADNDKLACMVGNMIDADVVFLLTDVNGVYTANPSRDPNAKLVKCVHDIHDLRRQCQLSDEGSAWGTGGIAAKVYAAYLASTLGVRSVIMSADDSSKITSYVEDLDNCEHDFGTTFMPIPNPPNERKRWIKSLMRRGSIQIDGVAIRSLINGASVKPENVIDVCGDFSPLESVKIIDRFGNVIGCGLSNYASDQVTMVKGLSECDISDEIQDMLGDSEYVLEHENFVFFKDIEPPASIQKDIPVTQPGVSATTVESC